eukprot:TRINITY_DN3109_c0_g1_i1.p1 TRINITY_DN3109_c0_g1~~TRINITY_DN3109_c0_g1_i1.p1  ORF type:complete len:314 (+),score=86.84 TRINITY_DN3109_c0_g1_i1:223-1164(+)
MGDFNEHEFLQKEVNKEEARLRRLLGEDNDKGGIGEGPSPTGSPQPRTIMRPSMRKVGTAEAALGRGETEEEMIKRKTQELKAKAHQKQKKEQEPEWRKRQREKEETAKREHALREHQYSQARAAHSNAELERERAVASGDLVTSSNSGDRERDELVQLIKLRKEREARELAAELAPSQASSQVSESEAARREAARLRARYLSTDNDDDSAKTSAPASPQIHVQAPTPSKPAASPATPRAGAAGWNINRVCEWLTTIGLDEAKVSEVQAAFRQNDIVGPALLSLSKEDMQEMGITSLGIKKTLAAAVAELPRN